MSDKGDYLCVSFRETTKSGKYLKNKGDVYKRQEENFLNISLTVGGKRLQHKAFLNESGTGSMAFPVVPEGKLVLTADSVADRKIFNINIRLTLNNRGGTPFGLKALELHDPEISAPIISVSYTHLDVYKRQVLPKVSITASMPMVCNPLMICSLPPTSMPRMNSSAQINTVMTV